MCLSDKSDNLQIDSRLNSPDWGIWGKEKYSFNDQQNNDKHLQESLLLDKLLEGVPERLKIALRYTFGICDLNAYAMPISEVEFKYLSDLYQDALIYASSIQDNGLRELVQELYCINKTAAEIPGFTEGNLVNETLNPEIWRKYIYLDFFKFSLINMLMRESISNIVEFTSEQLASKLITSYFLGIGSFVEKVSILFSEQAFCKIIERLKIMCKKIEIYPEFPDINSSNYSNEFFELLVHITNNRKSCDNESIQQFLLSRYNPFIICDQYYAKYFNSEYSSNEFYEEILHYKNRPLKMIVKLYDLMKKSKVLNTIELLSVLRKVRSLVDEKYFDDSLLKADLNIENFYANTTHPFFQALIYEGKILSILFNADYPESGRYFSSLFIELVPFYAMFFSKNGKLFVYDTKMPNDLPRLILAHHIHNANCEKLYDKMAINKMIIWDTEKVFFNISSSSSKVDIVLKEREICLELGYNHYRLHARQHLKAGNQNRAIPNSINGIGKEYYLTLDDDYFVFPDFAMCGHHKILSDNMDYVQAPLAFRGIYDYVTRGEQVDAESMLFFEAIYGRNYPRNYVFPRGTGTIFNFTDGKNSLTDTGGFLVDFSCEDFGQGYVSLIQHHSEIFGNINCENTEGEITDTIYVIGEGVDLNGKLKQMERWMQGSSKILFHLLLPTLFKSILRGETELLSNKQMMSTFNLTAMGITFRFMLFSFFCIPFLYSSLATGNILLPEMVHINMLVLVIFVNLLSLFSMYFYIQRKVSLASTIRLILIEPIITVPAIIGYLKGIFGVTPKIWSANKSKKHAHYSYRGVYILLLMNIFSIVTFINLEFWPFFWPFLNIVLIITGFFVFRRNHVPKDPLIRIPLKHPFITWIAFIAMSTIFNIWFFILEFKFASNGLKMAILGIMAFNFYMSFRMMLLNVILVYKLKKSKGNICNQNS